MEKLRADCINIILTYAGFFFSCLVVFIPPNVSWYLDSFLNYLVVSYYPNRDMCIKGVCYDQFQKNYDVSSRPGNEG